MNQKEYALLINDISNKLNPLNQLLYQAFILIVFYYVFDTLSNIKSHKSFILLVACICILLDFCIWNNLLQSALFFSIVILYISYNFHRETINETFINTITDINTKVINNKKQTIKKNNIDTKNKNEIDKITFIPNNFNISNTSNNKISVPEPYTKLISEINDINSAYKADTPNLRITDSHYAKIMLNELYETSQYKNIKKNKIDEALDNNININNNEINNNDNDTNNKNNIDLFKHPKKIFLDKEWLNKKSNTYNYSCVSNNCMKDNIINKDNNSKKRNKNAICSVVQFGNELSECTNQDDTITNTQLNKISNNKINTEII